MSRTMDKPNKVKAKLIVEVETEFYDNESSEETLRYCVEQDLEDAGFNVIDVSVMNDDFFAEISRKEENMNRKSIKSFDELKTRDLDMEEEDMER